MKHTIELPDEGLSLNHLLIIIEIDLIQQALANAHYNKSEAAKLLKINPTTLFMKMKRFGLSSRTGEKRKNDS